MDSFRITGPAISICVLAALLLVAGSDSPFMVAHKKASVTRLNAGTERVSVSHGSASYAGNPFIEEVCSKSGESNFCRSVLNVDPRTKNASVLELGLVSIHLASNTANSTKIKIQSLNTSTDDPQFKDSLAFCGEYYEDALYALGDARTSLNNKEYVDACLLAGKVYNDARNCERKLSNPPVKSPFTKENQDLERFANIIATASNILDGQSQSLSPEASASSSLVPFSFYLPFVSLFY